MDEVTQQQKPCISVEQAGLWRTLIEARTGMILPERQHGLFEQRILNQMAQHDLDAKSYYQLVCQDSAEWQRLVEALMVHETTFFRHQASFDFVESYLVKANQAVKIWSVGCSSGEEAWSLAMLADRFSLYGYEVLATDISHQVLMQAKQGLYSLRKSLSIPERFRTCYGQTVNQNQWQISEQLKSKVLFRPFNLKNIVSLPFRKLDIIFCHNVLIYFKKFDRRDILNALVQCLAQGGILVLGPGEILDWHHPQLKKIEQSGILAYEKFYK